jgi:ubiquinone/menaquinone biosynthesis C-methylase UbiE
LSDIRDEMVKRLLLDAGIRCSMRVLDIGCGTGDVSILLAGLVGDMGEVVGIDQDANSLSIAQNRVNQLKITNLSFVQGNLNDQLQEIGMFDAVVGRRVLMYLPEPVESIHKISAVLKPGGVVVLQEHDSTMGPGRLTPMPLHEQVLNWIRQTIECEGADIHMGFHLPFVLTQAGLVVEHVRAEAIVHTPETNYPFANIVRSMLPRIVRYQVASEDEIDIDTLEKRLIEERRNANSVYISEMVFGIWARKPDEK